MIKLHWWKIGREINRVGHQLLQLPVEMVKLVVLRRWYDTVTSRSINRSPGDLPLTDEVGIYLIFPRNGVQLSHLTMLREMRQAGIAPIVVTNVPLADADKALLKPLTARIIERPNVGYDFGGYRDGVLDIAGHLQDLTHLWLLNDSVWLVPQPVSWFDQARALGTDFMAATSNYAMPRVDPHRFREISWQHSPNHKNFHYASYALGFGKGILQCPAFLQYWKKLNISNDKTRTVRRGEIGLSQWVLRHGFSHDATYKIDELDIELASYDDDEVDRIARELVIPDDALLESVHTRVMAQDPRTIQGRTDRIALILTAVSRRASAYALPGYALRRGFQFLKKSPLWLSPAGATTSLRLIDRIEGPVGDEIQAEAQTLNAFPQDIE